MVPICRDSQLALPLQFGMKLGIDQPFIAQVHKSAAPYTDLAGIGTNAPRNITRGQSPICHQDRRTPPLQKREGIGTIANLL